MSRHDQYKVLEELIRTFMGSSNDAFSKKSSLHEPRELLRDNLPMICAQFINEEEEEYLRLVVGFNGFLSELRANYKSGNDDGIELVGRSNDPVSNSSISSVFMGNDELDKLTRNLCLDQIDSILPAVLFHAKPSALKFLTRLTAPLTLKDMIKGREQATIKGIVWELGRYTLQNGDAVNALKTAAVACLDRDRISNSNDLHPGTTAARDWVTKHFMYIFVNTVQLNWKSRTTAEQVQALRCLSTVLDFLHPNEASQYFPQVLATLSGAISDGCQEHADTETESHLLCLNAVRALSKFVRLVSKDNLQPVMDNLTNIVVSLIPVLEDGAWDIEMTTLYESRDEAVSLLETLTQGDIVREFSNAFSEIPFLPSSQALENVHKSLRENGINFDNLLVLSTTASASQSGSLSLRDSLSDSKKSSKSSERLSALRRTVDFDFVAA